jgi:hypothetical protein
MIRECWHVAIILAGRLSLPAICHNNLIQIDDKLLGLTVLLFSSVTLAPTLTTKLQSASIVVESLMLIVSFMLVNAESSNIGCVLKCLSHFCNGIFSNRNMLQYFRNIGGLGSFTLFVEGLVYTCDNSYCFQVLFGTRYAFQRLQDASDIPEPNLSMRSIAAIALTFIVFIVTTTVSV